MPKILIKKAKKQFIPDLNKEVTISSFEKYFVVDTNKDFHTKYGVIKKADLKKKDGSTLKTEQNKDFQIFSPSFIDYYKRMQRGPQIIPLKDIGAIIAVCGINKTSTVVDAGAGSGGLACFLAVICKSVTTYDILDEHLEVVKNNVKNLGLKNITVKKGDVTKKIDEKNVDVITLDLPAPWDALPQVKKALKVGGFCVSYSPTIPQVMDFCNAVDEHFYVIKTIELIEREWEVEGRKVRPKSKSSIHSGFLTFVRRIG